MQFGILDIGPPFFILAIVTVLPILYLIIRLIRPRSFSKGIKGLLGVVAGGNIMALLYFIFRLSIMPEDADKAYWLAMGFATFVLSFGMASDWVFRVRGSEPKSRKRKK